MTFLCTQYMTLCIVTHPVVNIKQYITQIDGSSMIEHSRGAIIIIITRYTHAQMPRAECIINPRRACAARVTVVVLCVCVSVCPRLFSDYRLRGGL